LSEDIVGGGTRGLGVVLRAIVSDSQPARDSVYDWQRGSYFSPCMARHGVLQCAIIEDG